MDHYENEEGTMNSHTDPQNAKLDNIKAGEKPGTHEILYIHSGLDTKSPLSKENWNKVFAAFNLKIELLVIQGQWDPEFRIKWSRWEDNKGLVACSNEKTVKLFSEMVNEIDINGQRFRAWSTI